MLVYQSTAERRIHTCMTNAGISEGPPTDHFGKWTFCPFEAKDLDEAQLDFWFSTWSKTNQSLFEVESGETFAILRRYQSM